MKRSNFLQKINLFLQYFRSLFLERERNLLSNIANLYFNYIVNFSLFKLCNVLYLIRTLNNISRYLLISTCYLSIYFRVNSDFHEDFYHWIVPFIRSSQTKMGNLRSIFLDGNLHIFNNPAGASYYSHLHNLLHRVCLVRTGIHSLDFVRLQNLRQVKWIL